MSFYLLQAMGKDWGIRGGAVVGGGDLTAALLKLTIHLNRLGLPSRSSVLLVLLRYLLCVLCTSLFSCLIVFHFFFTVELWLIFNVLLCLLVSSYGLYSWLLAPSPSYVALC